MTPPDKIRYDACCVVDDGFEPSGEVGVQTIQAGDYAMTTHFGPYHWSPNSRGARTMATQEKIDLFKQLKKQDYVVGKLEGQWWSDRGRDLKKIPKRDWRWMLMIRTPDVVGKAKLQQAVKNLETKNKAPQAKEVKLESHGRHHEISITLRGSLIMATWLADMPRTATACSNCFNAFSYAFIIITGATPRVPLGSLVVSPPVAVRCVASPRLKDLRRQGKIPRRGRGA